MLRARRGLHRLPGRVAAAVAEFVTGPLADNPARLSKPLFGELTGLCSARRGDYRVAATSAAVVCQGGQLEHEAVAGHRDRHAGESFEALHPLDHGVAVAVDANSAE